MNFATIEEAIKEIKEGKFVIVVDDKDRENEGDLVCAAELCTADHINFMVKYARGLICLPCCPKRLEELKLPLMTPFSSDPLETAFTLSIDYKENTTTGISAHDRAATARALANFSNDSSKFRSPGHMFPLRAREEGVLGRAGHTEAAVDLVKIANLSPVAVISEVLGEDGNMAKLPELEALGKRFNIKIITIADIINYRRKREKLIERVVSTPLPTSYGNFILIAYETKLDKKVHLALQKGEIDPNIPTLVRVHSQCTTGDIFHSLRCDCGEQLHLALEIIGRSERGVILYLRQEGRDIGLLNKLRAYAIQDKGLDTVAANKALGLAPDLRHYGIGAQILVDLGVKKIRLLTNNPAKLIGLSGYDLEIVERIPLETEVNSYNRAYLTSKKELFGHTLNNI